MSNSLKARNAGTDVDESRRLTTETKNATKTTEFLAFGATVVAVIVAANLYDGNGMHGDAFGATTAMRYIVFLTIGYMIQPRVRQVRQPRALRRLRLAPDLVLPVPERASLA